LGQTIDPDTFTVAFSGNDQMSLGFLPRVARRLIPPELVIRESTAAPL